MKHNETVLFHINLINKYLGFEISFFYFNRNPDQPDT